MNISTSECSSGCESGWTMYLNQLSSSTNQCNRSMPIDGTEYRRKGGYIYEQDEDEDEDLSMLSDASSGPPQFQHQEEEEQEQEWCQETRYNYSLSVQNKHRLKVKDQGRMQQNFHLDDTASSPVLVSFPKGSQKSIFNQNNVAFENGKSLMEHDSSYSATHYKGKSVLKKHFGFFKASRTGKAD